MNEQSKRTVMNRISTIFCLALLISVIMSGCASDTTGRTNIKYDEYQGLFSNCDYSSANYQSYCYIKIENNKAKFWTEMTKNGVHWSGESDSTIYNLITQGNEVYMQDCETGDLIWKLEVEGDRLITYHKSTNYVNEDGVYEKM